MKDKVSFLIAFFVISSLFISLSYNKVEPLESFSLRFNDINFDLQTKEINKDIVFVAVDERSVNKFGRWPWNRNILADGINKLHQADIVLMDMIFSESTSLLEDSSISSAISNLNNSVCGFFLRQKATQFIKDDELNILDDSALDLLQAQITQHHNPLFISAPYAEINILPILESCTLSGSFSTLAQHDQLLRSYPIGVYYHRRLFPSLAIQGLRLVLNKDINRINHNEVSLNSRVLKLDEKGFIRLNFYKKEQYNIVSFLDVKDGTIKPEYFKNKIIILGITEIGSGDVVSTPIGSLYGPLLHYTFISNFLQEHLIYEPEYISYILMMIMMILPFILLIFIKNVLYRTLINFFSYLLIYIIVRYLFVLNMIYIDLFYPLISLLFSTAVVEILAFSHQEKNTRFIRDAFSAYLSADLLSQLIKNPHALALGGEKKHLSILFSDIRGFTALSEAMDAQSLVALLNRYFTPMTQAVLQNKGMLDKYIGDAIMAFYNAPVDVINHEEKACQTALDMIQKLAELNQDLHHEGLPMISIGIGINSADVIVGNMGSDTRFNYTVMGDGVNLASRVESLTKNYGIDILITEFTVAMLNGSFIFRKIEPVIVKGKENAVLLYELMPHTQKSKDIKKIYDNALEFYINEDILSAKQLFKKLIKEYNDSPSQYFLTNIEKNIKWGVCKMTQK
ncbi:adenylate/guanylate cyclase domain-containing protein [Sulfurimonas sp. SAG-AH-194-C20]|nr:adenylate/guanylate cyclase domain-containing protein [Sulfurimonas sp. SAG-AH-194-C20]MDF1879331.1 adenylate/guanylate cyclase domain-containing protein [Sulfurimonas sp. SAG-AH-194-C20]